MTRIIIYNWYIIEWKLLIWKITVHPSRLFKIYSMQCYSNCIQKFWNNLDGRPAKYRLEGSKICIWCWICWEFWVLTLCLHFSSFLAIFPGVNELANLKYIPDSAWFHHNFKYCQHIKRIKYQISQHCYKLNILIILPLYIN